MLDSTGGMLEGSATYSAPSWDGTEWMVNARNLSTYASTWKLQVRVLCASALTGYEVVPFETAVDSVAGKQLQMSCPAGKKALGAGWSVLDSTNIILEGEALYFGPSYDGSGWLVNARNTSSFASSWKLKGQLLCAPESSLSGYEVVTTESPVDGTSWKQVQAACSTGKKALGAGWGVLDSSSGILDGAALHFESGYDGSTWLTNAKNHSTYAPSWKLWVRLICM